MDEIQLVKKQLMLHSLYRFAFFVYKDNMCLCMFGDNNQHEAK